MENIDIEKSNPWASIEDQVEPNIPTATLQLYNHISSLEKAKESNVLRASSANNCVKRRWYQHHGAEATPLAPRKILNFMLGDIAEITIKYFISQALVGEGKLYSEVRFGEKVAKIDLNGKEIVIYSQPPMSFTYKGSRIAGHPDGLGRRSSDGRWELIEIKSAANYGYLGFTRNEPNDYLKQAHAMLEMDEIKALDCCEVRFFFMRKETGAIWDRLYLADPEMTELVLKEFEESIADEEPKAPYELVDETKTVQKNYQKYKVPTGRKVAKFPCSYCPYLKQCKGEFKKEFKQDQFGPYKPTYIFEEKTCNSKQNDQAST